MQKSKKHYKLTELKNTRPLAMRVTCQISQILNSIHEGSRFLSKTLGKSLFHFRNGRSGHGSDGQF